MENGYKRVFRNEIIERQIGGPTAIMSVDHHEAGGWGRASGEANQFPRRDAFPKIAEPRPARHTMEIGKDPNPRKIYKIIPTPLDIFSYQTADAEAPCREIDRRWPAGIEHRPFSGARLAGRNAFKTPGIGADDYIGGQAVR